MPTYDYKCGKCGKVFEVRQSFSDPLLTTHEECGGPLERLISAPALQFKGTGWYITDYARAGNANTKNGETSEKKTEKKTETKSDSSSSSTPSSTSKSE
jgi:putative FmdB family regulatory protein